MAVGAFGRLDLAVGVLVAGAVVPEVDFVDVVEETLVLGLLEGGGEGCGVGEGGGGGEGEVGEVGFEEVVVGEEGAVPAGDFDEDDAD